MLSQTGFPDTPSHNQMLRRHDTQTANNTLKDRIADTPTCRTLTRHRSHCPAVRPFKQSEDISDDGQSCFVTYAYGDRNFELRHMHAVLRILHDVSSELRGIQLCPDLASMTSCNACGRDSSIV